MDWIRRLAPATARRAAHARAGRWRWYPRLESLVVGGCSRARWLGCSALGAFNHRCRGRTL